MDPDVQEKAERFDFARCLFRSARASSDIAYNAQN